MHTFFKKTVVLEVSKERKNWLVATLLEKPGNFLFFKISQELKLKKKKSKKLYQNLFRYKKSETCNELTKKFIFIYLTCIKIVVVLFCAQFAYFQVNRYTLWGCTCSAYRIWALSHKNNWHDRSTVKTSYWKNFVMLWGTGTILSWCFLIKIFTLSVHCPLNTSAIKNHFLVEQRSSSSFLFLT